jgi:hypothetical protein
MAVTADTDWTYAILSLSSRQFSTITPALIACNQKSRLPYNGRIAFPNSWRDE